jgi:hypothetical protein
MNWQHESAEHLSLRHTSLAHHVGDALALPQEDWIVTFRATEAETLNRERRIKCQPGLGCHLRLLQLPQIRQSRSEKEMHERKIGIEFDGATKPFHRIFVIAKLHLGSARKMHPQPCAIIAWREPERLILVTLGFLTATVK